MDDFILDKAGRYIRGEMTREERQEFESGMQENEELSCLVRLCREINYGINEDGCCDGNTFRLNKTLKKLNTIYFGPDTR